MRMDYGLRQELSQKLVMTPQLRQAIAILQLSSLELVEMVEAELLENPVLEVEDNRLGEAEGEVPADSGSLDLANDYLEWVKYLDEGIDTGFVPAAEEEKSSAEFYGATMVPLHEHLEFQLHLAALNASARRAGEYLIGCIDDNGYLRVSVEEAAAALAMPAALVEEVLTLIQTFDPPGVGARDLRECLSIQARQRGITDPVAWAVIDGYLPDIAAGRLRCIANKLGCTTQDVQRAVDIIRTLDPKPGRGFGQGNQSAYILPDVTVERVGGRYVILVNDSIVPRLTINPYYRRLMREADSDARRFVEGRINAALWLMRSIEQRRRTLYNVVEAIVDLQRDFFDHGPKFLRPLTMKKVAERLGIHESTVSRATANKYAATPHGLLALRAFFSAGVQGAGGEDVAACQVKREIRELVAREDPAHPLSDQALTELLSRRGIAVSRRTVAKYREELGIPSSCKRKRY